ncbi:type VII secretion-associated serine protease mycosin [Mycobacterium sp. SMC-4]|uniref:type VII secretion-associated serine protease mycosin n=1 Tax=Mycobacterium sp. SMC-4 TaxID=2857059 RepID=UPI0021B379A8|nr:type VII secretion-associated serine protease mycosin [Mycobacterium sp. SMC-4]UXA20578.1 type VII secretion-associated serine protease mycosin [Mycobacterium sp. SMC-4]
MATAPTAAAVSPPPVDDTLLPPAAAPAPPAPTMRHDDCVADRPGAGALDRAPAWDAASVWALTRGAGQTVAVIDTGVAPHRRLPNLIPGGDFVSTQDGTADCDGHGTAVAGIIAARPDSDTPPGFTGIAPDVAILAIRQSSNKFRVSDDRSQSGVGDVDTLAAAVRTAADLGAGVINVSSVACQSVDADLDDRALGAALAYAVDVKNVVVVSAAGNVGGPGQCPDANPRDAANAADVAVVVSPAWYDDYVLTVGSVGADGHASPFSLAGPWVDVAAPGEDVVSLAAAADGLVDRSPQDTALSGTSYAAPVVSAVAALVRARFPELTARQVMARIEETALHPTGGWNPVVGHGVVDILAAVSGPTATSNTRLSPMTRPTLPPPPQAVSTPGHDRSAVSAVLICLSLVGGVGVVAAALGRLRGRVTDD